MNLPLRVTFYSADYALDGGSTTLYATDEHGAEHHAARTPFSAET